MINKISLTTCSIVLTASLVACGSASTPTTTQSNPSTPSSSTNQSSSTKEKPVVPETHPVGDIPDSQAFISYKSSQNGYHLVVPEGWARSTKGNMVQFVSKLDGVSVTSLTPFSSNLSADLVKTNWIPQLQKQERAVKVKSVTEVQLPSGKAIRVVYSSNSDPNSVTGKQVRLEDSAYLYQNNNKLEVLKLWAPYGADNVDQWKKMSDSFGWN